MSAADHEQGTDEPLPLALNHIQTVFRGPSAPRLGVFLDYDGTLTPIVARPELAILADDMRRTLRALARHTVVGIISGRDLSDLRQRVGLDELYYAGSHGFDIEGPAPLRITHQVAEDYLPGLERAERRLRERRCMPEGIRIERKKFCIAIHYRGADPAVTEDARAALAGVLDEIKGLRLHTGKKVWELRPDVDWDKGSAVRFLVDRAPGLDRQESRILYIGDDSTDEDVFRRLGPKDMGILVDAGGKRKTAAHYRLHRPEEVMAFLQGLGRLYRL